MGNAVEGVGGMTRREALARHLMGGGREWQDMGQPYEELRSGLRVRQEQPEYGAKVYPEMPLWEWKRGEEAREILEFLGLDPEEVVG